MASRWLRLVIIGVLPLAASGSLGGCAGSRNASSPVSHPEALRAQREGLAVEFLPQIDRVTYFGGSASKDANLLHVVDLDRPRPTDGSYVFWGGCYTWVSPQKAPGADPASPMGWVADDGAKKDWPPDPAMDVGPVRRTSGGPGSFSVAGPEQRSGLQELKSFEVLAFDQARFAYTLVNRGSRTIPAGPWINTAASDQDVLAVRVPAGIQVWGWDQRSVDAFMGALGPAGSRGGWRTLDLSGARWEGGIKVYLAAPSGVDMGAVEIAVWRRDARAWMHRSLGPMSAAEVKRLRDAGEGPVAVYIQPATKAGPAIIEAELYGPIADLEPGAQTTAVERWRVIPGETADAGALP